MNRTLRKLLVPAVALGLGGTGFAFMAGGAVNPSYGSTNYVPVNGYAVFQVTFTPGDSLGTVGYIHFNSIPMDNSKSTDSWPAYGQVEVAGTWYSCTSAWDGVDSRTNSYTDSYLGGGKINDSGTPQASWTCDVRAGGISADTWTGVNMLKFLVLS